MGGRVEGESPASVGGNVMCKPGRIVLARDLYVGGGELENREIHDCTKQAIWQLY